MHFFPLLCTSVSSGMKTSVGPRARLLLWKWMAYVSIPIHVYISFLLKPVCMTAVSLDHLCTLCMRVPVCLSAPLEWSCLVRQTVKGWGQGGSVGMRPCVLFVKINHLDKDIWREFILNSCKSKLLCVDWWCNRTTPQVWIWSSPRTRK